VTVPASVLQLVNTASQNINAAATNLVQWSTPIPSWGVDFTFDAGVDNTKVTINTAGTYAISCTVAYTTVGTRYNGMLDTIVNGAAAVGPRSSCGYTRNAGSGNDNGSLHVPFFLYPFAAGAYIQMQVTREATTTGTTNTTAQRSVLTLMRIK